MVMARVRRDGADLVGVRVRVRVGVRGRARVRGGMEVTWKTKRSARPSVATGTLALVTSSSSS